MQDNKKTSVALDRQVRGYPSPKYHILVVSYARDKDISQSEVVCEALKLFFDSMPADVKDRLLNSEH